MKKKLLIIVVSTLICGLFFTNCGSKSSSGVSKNEYFGALPSIHADYQADIDALDKKTEEEANKLAEGGDKNESKFMKLAEEYEKKEKELKEKFKADIKAETEKLNGVEIPVSFSENLKKSEELFYDISNVKLVNDNGKLKMSFKITANKDFEVPEYKGLDYAAYFRYFKKDGSLIMKSVFLPVKMETTPLNIAANQVLLEDDLTMSFGKNAADYADFAGIEFITQEEYNTAK